MAGALAASMLQRFDVAQLPAAPWKNGGGSTCEVACWPVGAGFEAFDWRVSIASIVSSGPFSVFAGVDRLITLLEGDGVQLQGPGIARRLDVPLQPFAFSGDVPIDCTLLGGPSTDFNVMSRRGRVRAELHVLCADTELPAAPHGLLLALRGRWQAGDEALAAQQGLWWAGADRAWPLQSSEADAVLLAAAWHPAKA
ncbi:MAG: HutD family protein [Variovorax sp.]|nr:HutD family protein [Variovorax sp.]